MLRTGLRLLIAMAFVAIGVSHFTNPDPFLRIVPSALPDPLLLVKISGGAEIAGGLGLLLSATRPWAARGLILLLIAVFPANVNMAINDIQLSEAGGIPGWAVWARLPLQAVLIALVWWVGKSGAPRE